VKSISVFVDATPEGEFRAAYAASFAHQRGAHLIGVHVVSAGCPEARFYVRGANAIKSMLDSQHAADEALTATVRERFETIASQHNVRAELRVMRRGSPADEVILSLLPCDIVVVGHRELRELPGYSAPETLLLASGSPILVVPTDWKTETVGERIIVAWNASREARRAVTDALPLLVAAQSVTVLVVDPEASDRHGQEPGSDIALFLARQGARVDVERRSSKGASVAEVILCCATERNADLIVIGAYSRPRTAEIMFGGVTRTMLKRLPIPVLLSR
jgi:nucleotide-binding universal stress UspA family protein